MQPAHKARIYPRRVASVLGWGALALLLGPALIDILMRSLGLGVFDSGIALACATVGAPVAGLIAGFLRVFGLPYGSEVPTAEIEQGYTSPRWGSASVELGLRSGQQLSLRVDSVS